MAPLRSALLRAALAAALLLISLPLPASAHAELVSTIPADGAAVSTTPEVISATFDEALGAGSAIELRDQGGTTLADGAADPADPTTLALEPPDLHDGTYEVRWTAVAVDGDVTRGTFRFDVALPPTIVPTPASTPSAAPPPTPTPAATPSPTPAPSPAPTEPGAGNDDVLIPILAGVALLGAFGAWLLRRRGGG